MWSKITSKLRLSEFYPKIVNVFFENFYGIRQARKPVSALSYVALFFVLLEVFCIMDRHPYARRFLHSNGSNEIVIGITTILLALLIPIAIALVEDARKSVLERQAIIRSIIRLALMPIAIIAICFFLVIPTGLHLFSHTITLRTVVAAMVLCCFYFIIMGFFRAYRWLADGSLYSSGSPDTPEPDSPMPDAFTSYRFAQLIRLLKGSKGYETWIAIWQHWFPPEYENVIHAAFFARQQEVLKKKKVKRYIVLSLEMEAYEKYYSKRNQSTWWFTSDYLKQFLLMHVEIEKIIRADRTSTSTAGLWRAKSALERLLKKMISESMDSERSWNLFEAMGEYLKAADLLFIGKHDTIHDTTILTHFVTELLEFLLKDHVNVFNIKSDLVEREYWLITYDNLYAKSYNVSFVVEKVFKEWFFNKLSNLKNIENPYAFDSIFDALFPGSDTITIADMYWFLYHGKNTTDADLIVKLHYENIRPFGVFGRVVESNWVNDAADRQQNFRRTYDQQIDHAVKLFATTYFSYFEQFWKLDQLIAATRKALRRKTLKDREKDRLKFLLNWLLKVKAFYKTERAKANDERKKSKS
jgi:hypothetical protein